VAIVVAAIVVSRFYTHEASGIRIAAPQASVEARRGYATGGDPLTNLFAA